VFALLLWYLKAHERDGIVYLYQLAFCLWPLAVYSVVCLNSGTDRVLVDSVLCSAYVWAKVQNNVFLSCIILTPVLAYHFHTSLYLNRVLRKVFFRCHPNFDDSADV
jgi:hypothetical protein